MDGFDSSRFQELKRLGAGGFGVVYLVRDLERGGEVALKRLKGFGRETYSRLKREFRALADLRHENLVSFYELFVTDESAYFTMEYVAGRTILDHVRDGLGVDYRRLRGALSQLATGLSVLHEAGKLHRDVKPSNVLVTSTGRVVLLDFGLATEIGGRKLGESMELAGTPEYMSPEQPLGKSLTAASDWYSVGILLYEALTGRLPFRGFLPQPSDPRRAKPPAPREVDPSVPADLSDLCISLLTEESSLRSGAKEILALVGQTSSRPSHPLGERVFFGRQGELTQLEAALARVQTGEAVTVMVDGSSGAGKTSLVEHFLTQGNRPETTIVLRGRCYEREQVPYQGIDSLIDDLRRLLQGLVPGLADSVLPRHLAALVRLFPDLERVQAVAERAGHGRLGNADEGEIRRQAFGAFRDLLARIADEFARRGRTLILHIDDLQWGDLDTARLLRDVLRPPDAPVMLLLLAYRSEDQDRSPCLKVLSEQPVGTEVRMHLGPLSPEAAEALVRKLLPGRQDGLNVARLAQGAGGNPFLLQEVARFAQEGVGLDVTSVDVHAALRARIDRLPLSALELLQTVAVAGHPVTEQVARSAAAPVGPTAELWRLLVAEHLVRFSGPPEARLVEAFHDRVRETVVVAMTPQRARACHRGLAAALEQAASVDPEVLARHHESAGNPERALEFTVKAAEQATRALAFERAARLLQHAVGLSSDDHKQRLELLESLAEALGNAGRCVESARVYLEAADTSDPGARVQLRRRAADQLLFAGKVDEGRQLIRDDLQAHGIRLPKRPRRILATALLLRAYVRVRGFGPRPQLRFRVRDSAEIPTETLAFLDHLRSVSMVMSFVGLPRLGAALAARFVLRALDVGERRLVALGLALAAAHSSAVAPFARRTDYLFKEMTRQGSGLDEPSVEGTLTAIRGVAAYYQGDWRVAVQCLDDAERVLRNCRGTLWELWSAYHVGISARFFLGEWDELRHRVLNGLRNARDRDNSYEMAGMCAPFGVVAWLAKDEPDEAKRTLTEVSARSLKEFPVQRYWFLVAETLVQLYLGDGLGAWAQIRLRWRAATLLGFHLQLVHLRGSCALAAAEEAKGGVKLDLVREAERAANGIQRIDLPYAAPLAGLLRAGVAAQRGIPYEASRCLQDAIQGLDRQEMPFYAAAARRRLAHLRGETVAEFAPGQDIVAPDAITRMLVPGFRNP